MKLLIVESPAKAKTISKYLDGEYTVKASIGHVRDLPKSNKTAIDIEGGFIPRYVVSPGKEKVLAEIKALADKADEVVLAPDPDREGEAIAWHIAQAVGLKKPKRIVFHEITKDAVQEAIKHPRGIDENLRKAQEARRVLDRLVGYDLSGLIWKKVRYGLSAGRVQSPALRIIMEREREIRAFVSHKYWVIEADALAKKAGGSFILACTEEPTDFAKVESILKIAKSEDWTVTDVEETEVKRASRAPFITSTLQQTASSRLGISPSRTMSLAQKLYEAGHITYMRTDSTNLSQVAVGQAAGVIKSLYGDNYHQAKKYSAKSKNAQEAHEAIRPTNLSKQSAGANDAEKKLYHLIWARTIASQMADATLMRTKITANVSSKSIPDFAVTGSRVLFDGWLAADPESRGEDVTLPKVATGDKLDITNARSTEKDTQPPPRYTEAGLIKELEKRGIGRPSTYASIIRTIEEREYVEKDGKSLKPTDTGDVVSSFLEDNFPSYISDTFTAEMEDKLDGIADGTQDYTTTLEKFYKPFQKEVREKSKLDKATNLGDADPKYKCPKCGSPMTIKLGRGGKFMSCARYPDCDGALMINGQEIKKDEPIGTDPTTGLPIYVLVGRFGPYVQLGEKMPKTKVKKPRKKKADVTATTTESAPAPIETPAPAPTKPKMASIPKGVDFTKVTVPDALKYLSVPRVLGTHPKTDEKITANIGRFGPYIVHESDFRSLKTPDDVYTIELPRALEIFALPKAVRKGRFAAKKK